jgi:hypothetical protein
MTTSMPNDQLSLLDAIAKNDTESVHFLIFGRRVCPNFVLNGQSPVVVASQNGREDILDVLLESHCDLTIQDFTDTTWRKKLVIWHSVRHILHLFHLTLPEKKKIYNRM